MIIQKLKTYRLKTLEVLNSGGDIQDLLKITDMGMNLRVELVKEKIIDILKKEIEVLEKAQLISEELVQA